MNWVQEELETVNLGDARLNRRLIKVVQAFSARPSGSIPLASQSWAEAKAAYRLLDNEKMSWQEVLLRHTEQTEARIRQQGSSVVLGLQDTTELDYTSQPGIAGTGRLNYEARRGMYVHPTLMATPEGSVLGVTDAWMWARKPKDEPDIKESARWIEGYCRLADSANRLPDSRLVYVADREADIRELMDTAHHLGYPADYLVRAKHNRNLAGGDQLWKRLKDAEIIGELEFTLPKNGKRPARQVRQTLRRIRIKLPKKGASPAVEVTAVLAREDHPPPGEKGLEWKLLTNREADTLDAVVELINWYRRRWLIEVFFKVLKSGCQVESLQLGTLEHLENALVLYLIVGWRILHLVTWGRECPELPCDVIFDKDEWESAWIVSRRTIPPETPPALGDMIHIIAGFGGHLGRKQDGHPGPKALWEGLETLRNFVVGIETYKQIMPGAG